MNQDFFVCKGHQNSCPKGPFENCGLCQQQQQPLMYSCTYMKKLQQRGKLNELRVLAAWNNHRG